MYGPVGLWPYRSYSFICHIPILRAGGGARRRESGCVRARHNRCVSSGCLHAPSPLANSQIDLVLRDNAQAYLKRLRPMASTLPFRSAGSHQCANLSSGTHQCTPGPSRCTGRTSQSASSASERQQNLRRQHAQARQGRLLFLVPSLRVAIMETRTGRCTPWQRSRDIRGSEGAAALTQQTQNGQSCPSNQVCTRFSSCRILRLISGWPRTQERSKRTPPARSQSPQRREGAQTLSTSAIHPCPSYSPTWPLIRSTQSPPCDPRHEDAMVASEHRLSSLA